MTTFSFTKLPEGPVDDNGVGYLHPAFRGPLFPASPSGNYVGGLSLGGGSPPRTLFLSDVSNPAAPSLLYNVQVFMGFADLGIDYDFDPLAVDDDGDVWGWNGNNIGKIYELPKDTQVPTLAFTWTDDNGQEDGLSPAQIFTFKARDGTVRILMFPQGTASAWNNPLCFLGVKGVAGLTRFATDGTWFPKFAFSDENDDIWVAGTPSQLSGVLLTTSLMFWRLTDLTGSSTYPSTVQTVTMPANGTFSWGIFADGAFIGVWMDANSRGNYYIKVDLATLVLTTRDVSTRPVGGPYGVNWTGIDTFAKTGAAMFPQLPPNPKHFFVISFPASAHSDDMRQMYEIKRDLTDGDSWELDQWSAGDKAADVLAGNDADKATVTAPGYLNGPDAFVGTRYYYSDAPDPDDEENADLFVYYFGSGGGGGGSGGSSEDDLTIRCWGFRLDDHGYWLLRLGPSMTLVFDRSTRQWSEWRSPGRNNFRAHVGCNWIGMTQTLGNYATDVVAGDDATGVLWILDPTYGNDDRTDTGNSPFTRKVIGGIPMSGRDTAPCGAVELTASLGNPALTGATVIMRTSDDAGHNYVNHGSQTITAGSYDQVVEWRALGLMKAPGRIFEVSDTGIARISSLDLR